MKTTIHLPMAIGAAVSGVAATAVLTLDTVPTAGDTITVGGKTYTWVASVTAAYQVLIGTLANSKLALVAAINGSGLTPANPLVTAAAFIVNAMTVTAKYVGTPGNAIAATETMTAGTNVWATPTLTGGVDSAQQMAAVLTTDGPIGPLDFSFVNVIQPGGRSDGVEPGHVATLEVHVSSDGINWVQSGSNLTLKPGGEGSLRVVTAKTHLSIRGSAPGGGTVRVDIGQRGLPFSGHVSLEVVGKRGLGKDFAGNYASAGRLAEPAKPEWPSDNEN